MSNVLASEKKHQVEALGRLGWSLRRIERETGVRRETASGYLRSAGIEIRAQGRWGRGRSKPANEVITDLAVASGAPKPKPANEVITDSAPVLSVTSSSCEPYRQLIEEALLQGQRAKTIWQRLVVNHGFSPRYSAVNRFTKKLQAAKPTEARCVIETPPGEEGQVDYGQGPLVRYPGTGQYRRPRLFILTLANSRKSVRLLTWKSSAQIWCELHEEAFRRLGGVCRVIVLDNLKEGVLRPDVYDPTLNPLYRDMLAHYGAVALPCRVRDPDRKGKVESAVGHTQKSLAGMRFEAIEPAQKHLDAWDERWADTRIHGTTKRQVRDMFLEEKPHLLPLPLEPFRYYEFGTRTVHTDGHVEVLASFYSVPPRLIGQRVKVTWNARSVRVLHLSTGELLREHPFTSRGKHRTAKEDVPAQTPLATMALIERAHKVSLSVGLLCDAVYAKDGQPGVRRIMGVMSLAKKYGAADLTVACDFALQLGSPTYRLVKSYLEHRPPLPTITQVDPLIRELTAYRDIIEQKTKENL